MIKGLLIVGLLGLGVLLGACASSSSPDVYSRQQVRRAYTAYDATVLEVRGVEIEGRRSRTGTLGGAWIGATAARSLGSGRGSRIAGAMGGVAGAVAGEGIEKAVTSDSGLEILLELDNGETVAVVQGADVTFTTGERVRVLRDGSSARVVPLR